MLGSKNCSNEYRLELQSEYILEISHEVVFSYQDKINCLIKIHMLLMSRVGPLNLRYFPQLHILT